jgi:hypothetical protein
MILALLVVPRSQGSEQGPIHLHAVRFFSCAAVPWDGGTVSPTYRRRKKSKRCRPLTSALIRTAALSELTWRTMRRFATAFGTGFREVKVGDEIRIHGRP